MKVEPTKAEINATRTRFLSARKSSSRQNPEVAASNADTIDDAEVIDEPSPLKTTHADTIDENLKPPPQVVEDLLCEGEVCTWFGPSYAGKTTLAIFLAICVACGIEFLGKRTRQGAVVYIAAEAPGNVMRRIQGAKKHFGLGRMPLLVAGEAIDLFDSLADMARVVYCVKQFEAVGGERVKLIVLDTLARSCGAGDENSTRDMSTVMRNLSHIAAATGAAVLVVHHTGVADTSRSRGSSVIYSSADGEIVCEYDRLQDARVLTVKKQRNLGTDGLKLGARFVRVDIGIDEWGKPQTVATVESTDVPDTPAVCKRMGEVEGAVIEFLAERKTGIKKAAVVAHFKGRYTSGSVYRAMKTLHAAHAIHEAAGMVVIADAAK